MFKRLTECRACGSQDLTEVFKFDRPMPLSNDFVKPGDEHQGFTPMEVLFCSRCTLAQLSVVVDPSILYKNYLYVTSNSVTMQRHFDRLTKDIISENGTGSLLEVGSNDGTFLNFSFSRGFGPVVGVDPAENLSPKSSAISQYVGFFGKEASETVNAMLHDKGGYSTIVARHCFCHQEWRPFMDAVVGCSNKKTLVCIEVPYVPDLLRRTEFDSLYQEHTSYLTLKSVVTLLKDYPFHLHHVIRYGIHGGAVLLMLRHNDSGIQPHLSAEEALSEEHVTVDDWKAFALSAENKIANLRDVVRGLVGKGKIVSAFGASAKASVLINACGFTKKDIAFVTDNSPLKPGRLVPGTDIPVVEEGEMLSLHPDVAVCGAWNYRTEILDKMSRWRARGGKFIFPDSPNMELV